MSTTLPVVLVTERARTESMDNVTAETPGGLPNVKVELITVGRRIAVRALRTFIQAFLSALGIGIAGPMIPGVSDSLPQGASWSTLLTALIVGAGAALIAALQLTYELSQQWDVTDPARLG
jgi:hypothetical protein